MKTKNLSKILLMAFAWAIGATQLQASDWSITFDGMVNTDKTNIVISESVATIGDVAMGTTSWGSVSEETVFTGPTNQNYADNDISLATLTAAGAQAGKKLIVYATITNSSDYGLTLQANWDSSNSLEFDNWQGATNGREITNNHPNAYDGRCFKMTIGNNTLGKLNEWTPLKVISWGMVISRITVAGGEGAILDPKFVLQTGTSWMLRTGTQGLYSSNSGNRSFGLLDCKAGQVITINASLDPNPATNVTLKSQNGNDYKYLVTADGDVRFHPARYINIHSITIDPGYSVTFKVGNDIHKVMWYEAGETVDAEADLSQEGYTFSGWSGYPENMIMPEQNVTVSSSFSINYHNIVYQVNGGYYEGYYNIPYGTTLAPDYVPAIPTQEGKTFVGWQNLPVTMPDADLVIEALFDQVRTYKITYVADGQVVSVEDLSAGATPTPPTSATKTGYTFTGWSNVPETMPEEDVVATAQFTVNTYRLAYTVDGETYGTPEDIAYGATITPLDEPVREGFTFSGWLNVPETMPAQDVTISGTFSKELVYATLSVGATGYNTFCSTQPLKFVGTESVKAYIATAKSATEVTLTRVIGSVAAGTGLLLKGEANATARIEVVESGNEYTNNLLVGVSGSAQPINDATKYVLVNKSGTVKFADTAGYRATVPAGKAYLQVAAAARFINFYFEDEATAIEAVSSIYENDGTYYDLRGQRVQTPRNGLFILRSANGRQGKKVIIK